MKSVKTSISIDKELLLKIDEYAKAHYISRSTVLCLGARNLILQDEVIQTLKSMRNLIDKIANENDLSNESVKELEQFRAVCNALVGSAE